MSVGASGITIDLKGFTLRGDGSGLDHGIDDKVGGFDGLTVKNGVIVNFVDGIHAGGDVGGDADHVSVSEVVVSGNTAGISIEGDFATVQSVSASGNGDGVYVDGDMVRV